MLRSVYSDDVDQLKLSARNFSAQMNPKMMGEGTPGYWDDDMGRGFERRAKAARDRSNVSIKAPEAEQY